MPTKSSGKLGGASMLTEPLFLMRNHRPRLSTMWDGRLRESCKCVTSGSRSSKRTPATAASVKGRSFLLGCSAVGSTGDARRERLRGFL